MCSCDFNLHFPDDILFHVYIGHLYIFLCKVFVQAFCLCGKLGLFVF